MESSPATPARALVIGAGGHGRVVLDILLAARTFDVVGFLDNNASLHGRRVDGVRVHGAVADIRRISRELGVGAAIVAVGDNGTRRGIARDVDQADITLISAIHPSASIARSATIGRNVVIAAGVVVCAHCQVGDSTILNTGCVVDHQTMIGEGSHVCPGVRIAARVKVEAGAFLGIGSTVVPKVTIGCEAIVGAGAVVLEDVPAMATVVGVPARQVSLAVADDDTRAMLLPLRA